MQTFGKVFPCAAFGSMETAHTESLGTIRRSAVELAAGMNRPLPSYDPLLIRANISLSHMSGTTPDGLGTDGHEHAGGQDGIYRVGRGRRAGALVDRGTCESRIAERESQGNTARTAKASRGCSEDRRTSRSGRWLEANRCGNGNRGTNSSIDSPERVPKLRKWFFELRSVRARSSSRYRGRFVFSLHYPVGLCAASFSNCVNSDRTACTASSHTPPTPPLQRWGRSAPSC